MYLAYGLLGAAVVAVWLPAWRVQGRELPAWPVLFFAAIAVAWSTGIIDARAVAGLGVLAGLCVAAARAQRGWRAVWMVIVLLLSLALSIHAVPGFHNPKVFDGVRLSADAQPFTQYLNFDKGAVGLLLLAFFCRRAPQPGVSHRWGVAALIAMAGTVATLALGMALGVVRWDVKYPDGFWVFLIVNLLFTCVAEEAFFRGVIQDRLASVMGPRPWAVPASVAVSAGLFALAHAGGGPRMIALAGVAGLGYALAYARTRSIESAIGAHLLLNACHFLAFSYPALEVAARS